MESEAQDLFTVVRRSLCGMAESGGAAAALDPAAVDAMESLAAVIAARDDGGAAALEARTLLGWLHWYRYVALGGELAGGKLAAGHRTAASDMFLPVFVGPATTSELVAAAGSGETGRLLAEFPEQLLPELADAATEIGTRLLSDAAEAQDADKSVAAVRLWRRIVAVTAVNDAGRAGSLANLGVALQLRYAHSDAAADLDEAIQVGREAADACLDDDVDRASILANLAYGLESRFKRFKYTPDMDEEVCVRTAAVDAIEVDDPERATFMSDLATALHARFEHAGTPADLDEAIRVNRRALETAEDDDPDRLLFLSNMAAMLRIRFARRGEAVDLDEAIRTARDATTAAGPHDPDRADFLSSLTADLISRYERTGSTADLDEAVRACRAAAAATATRDPKRAGRLSDLGVVLLTRFENSGALEDLAGSVRACRAAVKATASDDPDLGAHLSNLGITVRARFERKRALRDAHEAVRICRAAVDATAPDDPDLPGRLTNLAAALEVRFERTGRAGDGAEAVEVGRAAVAATPQGHPDRSAMLSNLGLALRTRFELFDNPADLDQAVKLGRASVAALPADHPDRASRSGNFASALRARFELSKTRADYDSGTDPDRDEALAQYLSAVHADSAPPGIRIQAAREATALGSARGAVDLVDTLETAIGLLPTVAARHLTRPDQQYALENLAGLASDAAALALDDTRQPEAQRAAKALRLLEAGRAVILSVALETRSDLTDLRREHPALAEQYVQLCELINRPPARMRQGADRRAVSRALDELLAQIRAQPRFTGFGRLPAEEELLAEAVDGPVVTFNVNSRRSDALLLRSTGITAVELPGLDPATLRAKIEVFHRALRTTADPAAGFLGRTGAQAVVREVLGWLWEVAAEPALRALGIREAPAEGEWPRVWWATGGLLGLLPMHAASPHKAGDRSAAADATAPGPNLSPNSRNAVIDLAISSYTPTIRALTHARRRAATTAEAGHDRSLIVAMPTTPGLPPLSFAAAEAALLARRLPEPTLLTGIPISGKFYGQNVEEAQDIAKSRRQRPTLAAVSRQLPRCSIAHFACHGEHDPADPSRTRLLLQDHATRPLNIASLAGMRLERARLAYLSACHTAFPGDGNLADEAIHLAGAFQLAGFPHVIATLWEILGSTPVDLAADFYTRLKDSDGNGNETDRLDTARSAESLHHAVRALRDRPGLRALPSLWAAYIHAGA